MKEECNPCQRVNVFCVKFFVLANKILSRARNLLERFHDPKPQEAEILYSSFIKIGEVAPVPGHMWVRVKNTTPVVYGYHRTTIGYGDTCSINRHTGGSFLIVIGIDESNDAVLVEYRSREEGGGACCPPGVQFFLPAKKFLEFGEEYKQVCEMEKADRELVDLALANYEKKKKEASQNGKPKPSPQKRSRVKRVERKISKD